jgi:hypothetical protein
MVGLGLGFLASLRNILYPLLGELSADDLKVVPHFRPHGWSSLREGLALNLEHATFDAEGLHLSHVTIGLCIPLPSFGSRFRRALLSLPRAHTQALAARAVVLGGIVRAGTVTLK